MYNIIKIIILLISFEVYSQNEINAEILFKTHLFLNASDLDEYNYQKGDTKLIKSSFLLEDFINNINLELDTLKKIDNYSFYGIKEVNEKEKSLLKTSTDYIHLSGSNIKDYLIAVNHITGRSYKLKGFDMNDFLFLYGDFRQSYLRIHNKRINKKWFFKYVKIKSLDFKCMYKGLKSKRDVVTRQDMDYIFYDRYKCLRSVNRYFSPHGRIRVSWLQRFKSEIYEYKIKAKGCKSCE